MNKEMVRRQFSMMIIALLSLCVVSLSVYLVVRAYSEDSVDFGNSGDEESVIEYYLLERVHFDECKSDIADTTFRFECGPVSFQYKDEDEDISYHLGNHMDADTHYTYTDVTVDVKAFTDGSTTYEIDGDPVGVAEPEYDY